MSIDNLKEAQALIDGIEQNLPIYAYATPELIEMLREQGKLDWKIGQKLRIEKVSYSGDMGGILCHILPDEREDSIITITSITHLRIDENCPLAEPIKTYQEKRVMGLAIQNGQLGKARRLKNKQAKRGKGFG